jgi:tetratricopeptide (TPR) repeat protein
MSLGLNAAYLGDPTEGQHCMERALGLLRELGDRFGIARCLLSLGVIFDLQENYEQARAAYEESLALRRQIGDRRGIALCLANLAGTEMQLAHCARARELAAESLAMRQEMADRRGIAFCLALIGYLACKQGRFADALDPYTRSLKLHQEVGDRSGTADCLYGLAHVRLGLGQPYRAACVLAAIWAFRDDITKDFRPGFEQAIAGARSQLGDAVFEQAWAQGAGWPLDQAIAYALESSTAIGSAPTAPSSASRPARVGAGTDA